MALPAAGPDDAPALPHINATPATAVARNDARDFYPISPLGQVKVLRTDEGWLLSENTAILPYVADRYPAARLAPGADTAQRARLQQWLGFIGTELHKAVFVPLLDARAPEDVKRYARDKAPLRLGVLQDHLAQREYLLDAFSVGDAYRVTVLNWASYGGIDLSQWPAVAEYYKRLMLRPSVEAATEEFALFEEEVASARKVECGLPAARLVVAVLAEAAPGNVGHDRLGDFEWCAFRGHHAAARFRGVLHGPFDESVRASPRRLQRVRDLARVDLAHPFVTGHRTQMLEYRVFHHRLTPSSQAC